MAGMLTSNVSMSNARQKPVHCLRPTLKRMIKAFGCATARTTTWLYSTSLQSHAKTCARISDGRRSGNYKPSLWSYDFIQSLASEYGEERYLREASELVARVKGLLLGPKKRGSVWELEMIDDLQRLGICYHFEDEINRILSHVYEKICCNRSESNAKGLYAMALEFRLLRQHGFPISQEMFNCFKNSKGDFDQSLTCNIKGLLQLYEASFLLTFGENTLELAMDFSKKILSENLRQEFVKCDADLSFMVQKALDHPIHWRIQRPNSRWFIEAYQKRPHMNPMLLELAKLDFNIVQARHQQELQLVSRWWKQLGLYKMLPFARDRMVECYFWTLGGLFQPQYGYARMQIAKVNALITIIDDIYDVYGTFEELQLFTKAVQRWDNEAIEKLPEYMQLCYLALDNLINEIAYNVLKDQGLLVIRYLRKSWKDLCQSYLQEAKWFSMGYIPSFEEYISNAWISISAITIISHVYFVVTNPINNETIKSVYEYHDIVRNSGMILRLTNDLGTSSDEMARGDVPKSIECHVNETGESEEQAQEYVKLMIQETWKKTNKLRMANSPFPKIFITYAMDLGRMAQFMYQCGDGHGIQNQHIKNHISKILFHPIQ